MPRRRSSRLPRRRDWSRPIQLESLEPRRLLAAGSLPLGITPLDTGEVLLGTVGVTPVLFESNGANQTQNWTEQEILETLATVDEGVHWWSRALGRMDTVHTLDFVTDDTFALDPVETVYEPIDQSSERFEQYVGNFLTNQGYGDAPSIERAVQLFNHDQRLKLGTDWAFTIFIVDASEDEDGLFRSGGNFAGAFAYPGGLFIVTPSTRPASTIAHEMGHIFWARDEYPGGASYTDQRGYYNSPVLNAADNEDPDFVQRNSIMRGGDPLTFAYQAETSPASTFALVGWRDSDGDGIFDVSDVPLSLDAIGYFDAESSSYHITGSASAVPLRNQNSAGVQSDITLNRISELQYRLDSGPWVTAAAPDQQVFDFDLSVSVLSDFSTIQWRAIDLNVGITSEIVSGTSDVHGFSQSSINGFAFLDENDNGVRDAGESLISDAQVVVLGSDGSALFGGQLAATDFDAGDLPVSIAGVELSANGSLVRRRLGALDSADAGDKRVFQSFNTQSDQWQDRWSQGNALVAEFDQAVGEVELSVTGLDTGSYARVEAYDSFGQMITRVTSELIAGGEVRSLTVSDSFSRIAEVRVFGHAETSIAIDAIRFGYSADVVTDESGAWKIANLPDGDYQVELVSDTAIHQFNDSTWQMTVAGGSSSTIVAAAQRVTSPHHNVLLPEDVSGDGEITSRDALLVINDMTTYGRRILGPHETTDFQVDVNNDGSVSGLDALLVINELARRNTLEAESVAAKQATARSANDAVLTAWGQPAMLVGNRLLVDSDGRANDDESAMGLMADTDNVPPRRCGGIDWCAAHGWGAIEKHPKNRETQ